MKHKTVHTTIFADDHETELDITGHYYPGMPGSRDRYGVPLEPDDPDEMEIQSATNGDGAEVELTESEHERAIAKLWENL